MPTTKPEVWWEKTQGENVCNDPSRPADARDKRPQWGLAESVSDNCAIGQLVLEKQRVKDVSLKNVSN